MVTAGGDDILRFNAATYWSVLTFHTKAKLPQFQAWMEQYSSVRDFPYLHSDYLAKLHKWETTVIGPMTNLFHQRQHTMYSFVQKVENRVPSPQDPKILHSSLLLAASKQLKNLFNRQIGPKSRIALWFEIITNNKCLPLLLDDDKDAIIHIQDSILDSDAEETDLDNSDDSIKPDSFPFFHPASLFIFIADYVHHKFYTISFGNESEFTEQYAGILGHVRADTNNNSDEGSEEESDNDTTPSSRVLIRYKALYNSWSTICGRAFTEIFLVHSKQVSHEYFVAPEETPDTFMNTAERDIPAHENHIHFMKLFKHKIDSLISDNEYQATRDECRQKDIFFNYLRATQVQAIDSYGKWLSCRKERKSRREKLFKTKGTKVTPKMVKNKSDDWIDDIYMFGDLSLHHVFKPGSKRKRTRIKTSFKPRRRRKLQELLDGI